MVNRLQGADDKGYGPIVVFGDMFRKLDGTTQVTVAVAGFNAAQEYLAHVHNRPCAMGAGGSHYKIDTGVAAAEEDNEMWVGFTADGGGAGFFDFSFDHLARPEAQSIVIHEMSDGTRLTCTDLDDL